MESKAMNVVKNCLFIGLDSKLNFNYVIVKQ